MRLEAFGHVLDPMDSPSAPLSGWEVVTKASSDPPPDSLVLHILQPKNFTSAATAVEEYETQATSWPY